MKTVTIETKFVPGDEVFINRQEKVVVHCPICDGNKKIEYNGKMMTCPECHGVGEFTNDKKRWVTNDKPLKIKSMKANVDSDGAVTRRYKLSDGWSTLNRAEENLFESIEEAQARCDDLNKVRKYINLSDITVPESFAKTIPDGKKIADRVTYYKEHKQFDDEIVLNEENILTDGYVIYLVCKMLNIDIVRAAIE